MKTKQAQKDLTAADVKKIRATKIRVPPKIETLTKEQQKQEVIPGFAVIQQLSLF